jgi:hypothetical protein
MQAIVFSNYHMIEGFFDKCHDDVFKRGCGRIGSKEDEVTYFTINNMINEYDKYDK